MIGKRTKAIPFKVVLQETAQSLLENDSPIARLAGRFALLSPLLVESTSRKALIIDNQWSMVAIDRRESDLRISAETVHRRLIVGNKVGKLSIQGNFFDQHTFASLELKYDSATHGPSLTSYHNGDRDDIETVAQFIEDIDLGLLSPEPYTEQFRKATDMLREIRESDA